MNRQWNFWRFAFWALFAIFLATAVLNMAKVQGGFLTSYAADLFLPPWLYIVLRRLAMPGESINPVFRWLGASSERAALSLFLASSLSEVSQLFWPQGFFAGVFDPLDLVAYAAGLLACYTIDKRRVRAAAIASMSLPTATEPS